MYFNKFVVFTHTAFLHTSQLVTFPFVAMKWLLTTVLWRSAITCQSKTLVRVCHLCAAWMTSAHGMKKAAEKSGHELQCSQHWQFYTFFWYRCRWWRDLPSKQNIEQLLVHEAPISVRTTSCKVQKCQAALSSFHINARTPSQWEVTQGVQTGPTSSTFMQRCSARSLSNINRSTKCHIFQAQQQCERSAGATLNSLLRGQQSRTYLFIP